MDNAAKYYSSNDGTRQAIQPGETRVVIQPVTPQKPWNQRVIVASIISVLFMPLVGLLAVTMARKADVDYKAKNYERARAKNRMALGFAIAAYVIGTGISVAIIAINVMPIIEAQRALAH